MSAEAEEKAEKEREKREKSKPRPSEQSVPEALPKASTKKGGDGGDEMELDEEDLKIIQDTKKQGYCYFKRTLSEKDQSLLDAEQMKLRAVSREERSRACCTGSSCAVVCVRVLCSSRIAFFFFLFFAPRLIAEQVEP